MCKRQVLILLLCPALYGCAASLDQRLINNAGWRDESRKKIYDQSVVEFAASSPATQKEITAKLVNELYTANDARVPLTILANLGSGVRSAIPTLTKILSDFHDGASEARHLAATALGNIGLEAKSAVPELIKALSDAGSGGDATPEVVEALNKIGVTIPELTKAVGSHNYTVCRWAAESLGAIGPEAKSAAPALARALADSCPYCCGPSAAEALEKMGSSATSAIPELKKLLISSDASANSMARSILEKMGSEGVSTINATEQAQAEVERKYMAKWKSRIPELRSKIQKTHIPDSSCSDITGLPNQYIYSGGTDEEMFVLGKTDGCTRIHQGYTVFFCCPE